MIIARLRGGLGNQLFQYAVGTLAATRYGDELVLDDSFFYKVPGGATPRSYELESLRINARLISEKERSLVKRLCGKLSYFLPYPKGWTVYREPKVYSPFHIEGRFHGNLYLDGYWQSSKIVQEVSKKISAEFEPKEEFDHYLNQYKSLFLVPNTVALHVRRGDYVTNKNANAHHGTCDIDYYRRAIAYLKERIGSFQILVFSDDLEWSRENVQFECETRYVDSSKDAPAWLDMRLMAMCSHNVIANSSYSWWGAWLNRNPNKIVIAPKRWLAKREEKSDLIPATWVKL